MNDESTTHATLPAGRVARACREAVTEIAASRLKVIDSVAQARRRRPFPLPPRSLEKAKRMLAPEEVDVARQHRALEERRVLDLLALARAVLVDDPTFRVQVSVSDFALICEHYEGLDDG